MCAGHACHIFPVNARSFEVYGPGVVVFACPGCTPDQPISCEVDAANGQFLADSTTCQHYERQETSPSRTRDHLPCSPADIKSREQRLPFFYLFFTVHYDYDSGPEPPHARFHYQFGLSFHIFLPILDLSQSPAFSSVIQVLNAFPLLPRLHHTLSSAGS